MNANQIAQIAASLNVSPNQIKRAEEWSNVLFVVVTGKGARFVSKKVLKMDTIKLADVTAIAPTAPTPLGKIKVYADSDLKFYNTSPKKIIWEVDGQTVTAVFPIKEAKSTSPNYKVTSDKGERLVPCWQVIKSLETTPATSIVKFALSDFVKPQA